MADYLIQVVYTSNAAQLVTEGDRAAAAVERVGAAAARADASVPQLASSYARVATTMDQAAAASAKVTAGAERQVGLGREAAAVTQEQATRLAEMSTAELKVVAAQERYNTLLASGTATFGQLAYAQERLTRAQVAAPQERNILGLGSVANLAGAFVGIEAITKLYDLAKEGVQSLGQYDNAWKQVTSTIASTGGAAGVTTDHIKQLTEDLKAHSSASDVDILNAEKMLLTFNQVINQPGSGNDIFDRASQAALDISKRFGTDLPTSAKSLGIALQDPVGGMARLRREGISFTEEQKQQIKNYAAQNDLLGEQRVLLDAVNEQVGGAAKAQADSIQGQMEIARRSVEEMFRNIAADLAPAIRLLATSISAFTTSPFAPFVTGATLAAVAIFGINRAFMALGSLMEGPLGRGIRGFFGAEQAAATRAQAAATEELAAANNAAAAATGRLGAAQAEQAAAARSAAGANAADAATITGAGASGGRATLGLSGLAASGGAGLLASRAVGLAGFGVGIFAADQLAQTVTGKGQQNMKAIYDQLTQGQGESVRAGIEAFASEFSHKVIGGIPGVDDFTSYNAAMKHAQQQQQATEDAAKQAARRLQDQSRTPAGQAAVQAQGQYESLVQQQKDADQAVSDAEALLADPAKLTHAANTYVPAMFGSAYQTVDPQAVRTAQQQATTALDAVAKAQRTLNQDRADGKHTSGQLADAEDTLRQAQQRSADAADAVKKAQQGTALALKDVLDQAQHNAQYAQQLSTDVATLYARGVNTAVVQQLQTVEQQHPGTIHNLAKGITGPIVAALNQDQSVTESAKQMMDRAFGNANLAQANAAYGAVAGKTYADAFVSEVLKDLQANLPVPKADDPSGLAPLLLGGLVPGAGIPQSKVPVNPGAGQTQTFNPLFVPNHRAAGGPIWPGTWVTSEHGPETVHIGSDGRGYVVPHGGRGGWTPVPSHAAQVMHVTTTHHREYRQVGTTISGPVTVVAHDYADFEAQLRRKAAVSRLTQPR